MSDEPYLLTESHGAILIATLNRLEKLNALSGQTMALFEQAFNSEETHGRPSGFRVVWLIGC